MTWMLLHTIIVFQAAGVGSPAVATTQAYFSTRALCLEAAGELRANQFPTGYVQERALCVQASGVTEARGP